MALPSLYAHPGVNERLAIGLSLLSQQELAKQLQEILDKLDSSIIPPARKTKL
jgi:hypothetical protein